QKIPIGNRKKWEIRYTKPVQDENGLYCSVALRALGPLILIGLIASKSGESESFKSLGSIYGLKKSEKAAIACALNLWKKVKKDGGLK
ncbi:MAG: hypothetical protein OXQ96_00680, partial [Alphaproteobacteria bacterium]|nr:hypothetical protein [Alphaproteobacteria bacterium]